MSHNGPGHEHGPFRPPGPPAPLSMAPTVSPPSRFHSLSPSTSNSNPSPYPRSMGEFHSRQGLEAVETSFASPPASEYLQGPTSEPWSETFQSVSLPNYGAVGFASNVDRALVDHALVDRALPIDHVHLGAHHAAHAPSTVEQPRLQLLSSGVSITESGEGVIPQEALSIGDPGFEPFRGVVVKQNRPGNENHRSGSTARDPWGPKSSDHGLESPGGEIGNCVTGYPLAGFRRQLQGSELLKQVSQAVREVPRSSQKTVSKPTKSLPKSANLPKAAEIIPRIGVFEGHQFPRAQGAVIDQGVSEVLIHGVPNGVPIHGVLSRAPTPLTHPLHHSSPQHLPPQHLPPQHLPPQHLPPRISLHNAPSSTFPSLLRSSPQPPIEFRPHQFSRHKPPARTITPDPSTIVPPETQYGCVVEGPFSDGGWFGLKQKMTNPPVPFETPVLKGEDSVVP
ncbi:hypothetical protein B0I73DRAFT_162176 [Yarrowia lipolytica]|nr:hypothetical protein B0I73DRAFT_162176 [Yarrowia lipolytica]